MILLAASLVLGQSEPKPAHPKHPVVVVSEAPVSVREAREAFVRAEALLHKSGLPAMGIVGIKVADRTATRDEIVAEMARIAKVSAPAFRFTPAATAYDASVLKITPTLKPALQSLIQKGFVARVGPLAVGPTSSLTPKQFGDALGFFMARMAQVTHLPSPKWTPMLQGD